MAKSKPVHTIKLGRIKAAIWANQTEAGVRHNVTVQRLYKKGDQWLSSESFGREDLPLVCKVLDMAHTWLFQSPEPAGEAEPGDGDEAPSDLPV